MTTLVHWTKPLQMSLSSGKVMRFELVKTISNNCVFLKVKELQQCCCLMRRNRHNILCLECHFYSTTVYHNQFIRHLDKKCTIIFLYGRASYSCAQFSYALKWKCLKQMIVYSCLTSVHLLHSMQCQQLLYVNLTMTETSR